MSALAAHLRLASLFLSFAFGIVGMSTGINALAKSNKQKDAVRADATALGADISISTHDVSSTGVVVTVVCGLVALTSLLALAHAFVVRFRNALRGSRTVPLAGAHVLAFLSAWLFAALVPFTYYVADHQARTTATLGGVAVSQTVIQSLEDSLGVTGIYHKLGYLRAAAILPWFTLLFAATASALSYVYARQAAAAGIAGAAAPSFVSDSEKKREEAGVSEAA